MSLIILHDRLMICDSITTSGGVRMAPEPGHRKVVRCPDGSLFGTVGDRMAGEALQSWARAGMDFEKPPKLNFSKDYDGDYRWMLMRPDGSKFIGDLHLNMHGIGNDALGETDAVNLALGALDMIPIALEATASTFFTKRVFLQHALDVVLKRCIYVAAPVYVFDLDHPELDP